jgi:hypothetical protein
LTPHAVGIGLVVDQSIVFEGRTTGSHAGKVGRLGPRVNVVEDELAVGISIAIHPNRQILHAAVTVESQSMPSRLIAYIPHTLKVKQLSSQ